MYVYIRLSLIAGILGFACGIVILVKSLPWLFLFIGFLAFARVAKKPRIYTACGSARWGNLDDVTRLGMTQGKGLCVGYIAGSYSRGTSALALLKPSIPAIQACQEFLTAFKREASYYPVSLAKAVHTIVVAPVGVGKSTAVAVPFLLTCEESCVVMDQKGELANLTAEARLKMGHDVRILDPFKLVTQTPDTLNVIANIDPFSLLALDDCRDIATAMVVVTGKEHERHWNDSAMLWIAAMTALTVALGEEGNKSLQSIRELLTSPLRMQTAIQMMCQSENLMLARMGHQLTYFQERELNSVITTANRHMQFLDTPAVYQSTLTSSFNPEDLLKGKMTIYLVLPPDRMRSQSGLLRLWISSLLRVIVRRGGLNPEHNVHFVLDEAASLFHMEALDDAVDRLRGYGVRLQLYYQSMGQLTACWPDGRDQTLLSNTSQVFFCARDKITCDYVSAMLGKETIIVDGGGSSAGQGIQIGENGQISRKYDTGQSSSWSQKDRELKRPEEVAALDERLAITFTPGVPPLCTYLVRYYEQPPKSKRSLLSDIEMAIVFLVGGLLFAIGMSMLMRDMNFHLLRQIAH